MALPTLRPTGVTRHKLRRTRLAATGTLGGWGRVQTLGRQTGGKTLREIRNIPQGGIFPTSTACRNLCSDTVT